jgi:hypothetical protein
MRSNLWRALAVLSYSAVFCVTALADIIKSFSFDGAFSTINSPANFGRPTELNDINNSGAIVGFADSTGFIRNRNTYAIIQPPLAYATNPIGIKAIGKVVGV